MWRQKLILLYKIVFDIVFWSLLRNLFIRGTSEEMYIIFDLKIRLGKFSFLPNLKRWVAGRKFT